MPRAAFSLPRSRTKVERSTRATKPTVPSKPAGIIKVRAASESPSRHPYALRNRSKYFWYTALDESTRLCTLSGSFPDLQQVHDYFLDAQSFRQAEYPATFPPGLTWPPKQPSDIVPAIGVESAECLGEICFTKKICKNIRCTHSFDEWKKSSGDWQQHFSLRETPDRGIGVFAKTSLPKGTVLGWYAGTIVAATDIMNNDYIMELAIGDLTNFLSSGDNDSDSDCEDYPVDVALVDGYKTGNWTRFINHSCKAHAGFIIARVGGMRCMSVVLKKKLEEGEELTVDYGRGYWEGKRDVIRCRCGAKSCYSLVKEGKGKKKTGKKNTGEEVSVSRKTGRRGSMCESMTF